MNLEIPEDDEEVSVFAVEGLAVCGRTVPGRLGAAWVTAYSASAVIMRP
jgi:hypothetical protein